MDNTFFGGEATCGQLNLVVGTLAVTSNFANVTAQQAAGNILIVRTADQAEANFTGLAILLQQTGGLAVTTGIQLAPSGAGSIFAGDARLNVHVVSSQPVTGRWAVLNTPLALLNFSGCPAWPGAPGNPHFRGAIFTGSHITDADLTVTVGREVLGRNATAVHLDESVHISWNIGSFQHSLVGVIDRAFTTKQHGTQHIHAGHRRPVKKVAAPGSLGCGAKMPVAASSLSNGDVTPSGVLVTPVAIKVAQVIEAIFITGV